MIVVTTANGARGIPAAWEVLAGGGSAVDAVEAATRIVEDDAGEHTVGYGGYPNLLGEVELDASIVDGTGRRAGAVAALRGYRHAISVARQVMERLPHVLLVGDGAARFAAEIGMSAEDLLTPGAERAWREGLSGAVANDEIGRRALARLAAAAGDASPDAAGGAVHLADLVALATDPDHVAGTVNVIARDRDGRLASAVSTSGWAWKYPGRVGDSAVVGAGNYADDRFGAAAATGHGELAIRTGLCRSVVAGLAAGRGAVDACVDALADLDGLGVAGYAVDVRLVSLSASGEVAGVATQPGNRFAYRTADVDDVVTAAMVHAPVGGNGAG